MKRSFDINIIKILNFILLDNPNGDLYNKMGFTPIESFENIYTIKNTIESLSL